MLFVGCCVSQSLYCCVVLRTCLTCLIVLFFVLCLTWCVVGIAKKKKTVCDVRAVVELRWAVMHCVVMRLTFVLPCGGVLLLLRYCPHLTMFRVSSTPCWFMGPVGCVSGQLAPTYKSLGVSHIEADNFHLYCLQTATGSPLLSFGVSVGSLSVHTSLPPSFARALLVRERATGGWE